MTLDHLGITLPPTPTNLRRGPSTEDEVIIPLPVGTVFKVIGGPECNFGYTWWHIRLLKDGTHGWIAQGVGELEYWINPLSSPTPQELIGEWEHSDGGPPYYTFCQNGGFRMNFGVYVEHGTYLQLDPTSVYIEGESSDEGLKKPFGYSLDYYYWGDLLVITDGRWSQRLRRSSLGEYDLRCPGLAPDEPEAVDPTLFLPMPSQEEVLMCVLPQQESIGFSIIPTAHAARFEYGQCTDWLDQLYPELIRACLPTSGADAHRWDELFSQNCGFPVSDTPQIGDIAVWEIDALRRSGHVAYVTNVEGSNVTVTEYNVGELTEYTERGERPPNAHPESYSTDGLKFIHISEGISLLARTAEVHPTPADEHISYVIVLPENQLEDDIQQGLFVYRDRNGWNGVFFPKAYKVDSSLFFFVDPAWEITHLDWRGYYMTYVYLAYPS